MIFFKNSDVEINITAKHLINKVSNSDYVFRQKQQRIGANFSISV